MIDCEEVYAAAREEYRKAIRDQAAEIRRLQTALGKIADEPFSDLESVRAFVCAVLRRGA